MKPSSKKMTPKYDPCRKFRKGDRVRVAENKGRCLKPFTLKIGDVLTVSMDESNDDTFVIACKWHDRDFYLDPAYLELVTPAEELEIAAIFDDIKTGMWVVTKDNFTHAYFPYRIEISDNIANGKQEAKAAAEAERDRLNDEWRKEMDK